MPVRDYTNRPEVVKAVENARATILACWDEWEQGAGEAAQQAQCDDAWFDFIQAQLDAVLYGMLDELPQLSER